jgi:hypothetical protein
VKKVDKNNKSFEILQKPKLTYFTGISEENIYKQIELSSYYFDEN